MTAMHHALIRARFFQDLLKRGDNRLALDVKTGSLGAVSPPTH
jgi:hypothetical protein